MKNINLKNKIQLKHIGKIFSLQNIIFFIVLYLMIALILNPTKYITSASEGIMLWATNLLPALFPFFILTKLIMEFDLLETSARFMSKLMKKIFNTSGNSGYLFLISIFSGYPIGSKIVADAYMSKKIDYTELHRLITFTSVSGPLFIIGTVGINMLENPICGYIIIISHILSAILNGVCYKNFIPHKLCYVKSLDAKKTPKNILTYAVKNSVESILLIGGLVCLFYVGMDAISSIVTLPPIIQGILEITKGCYEISISNISIQLKTIICTGLITFGGLCIHSQAMSFLKECNISYKFFFTQKCLQTFFSIVISSLLVLFI